MCRSHILGQPGGRNTITPTGNRCPPKAGSYPLSLLLWPLGYLRAVKMRCPRCQAENREGARFCRECGTRFDVVCLKCGAKVEPENSFCDACGSSIPIAVTPTPLPSRFASPESYTPKHLAEKILTSRRPRRRAQAGHRALRRPQGLDGAAGRPRSRGGPEAPRPGPRANDGGRPPLRRHREPGDGRRHHGAVRRAAGPRGPRGAGLLRRARDAGGRQALRRGGPAHRTGSPVQIRVGLNSGEVVVRAIGNDLHMDYTAVGQTTHLAARMEQMAMPGSILLTAETLRLAEGFVAGRRRWARCRQGPREPRRGLRARRRQAGCGRGCRPPRPAGLTRFVGRAARSSSSSARPWSGPAPGHGQVVALVGEPGRRASPAWSTSSPTPTAPRAGSSWRAAPCPTARPPRTCRVIDLLKAYFQIEDRDDAPARSARRSRASS